MPDCIEHVCDMLQVHFASTSQLIKCIAAAQLFKCILPRQLIERALWEGTRFLDTQQKKLKLKKITILYVTRLHKR